MLGYWYKSVLCTLLLVALVTPIAAEPLPHGQTEVSAGNYLALLDQGQYSDAWDSMSGLFRILNNRQRWMDVNQAIRNAYGTLLKRTTLRASYRKSYKNSPDGQYVIIQFSSTFSHKSSAVETVVLDCNESPSCLVREYIIN